MKKLITFVAFILLLVSAYNVAAETVPSGFEVFFEQKPITLSLFFSGERIVLKGRGSNIVFKADQIERAKIVDFMSRNFVDTATSEMIADRLITGVESSKRCVGKVSDCQLNPAEMDFIYGFADRFLEVVLAADLFKKTVSNKYIKQEKGTAALISSSSIYLNQYSGSDLNYNINNHSTLGIAKGFLYSDINLTDASEDQNVDFKLDELSYNYLYENNRLRLGFLSDRSVYAWNSTNFMADDSRFKGLALSFGSTNELESKAQANSKRLYFSSPLNGRFELLRDGKVIKSGQAQQGQNYVQYSDLSTGIYDAELRVYVSGKLASEQKIKIYNISGGLEVGDIDYMITLGRFEDQGYSFDDWPGRQERRLAGAHGDMSDETYNRYRSRAYDGNKRIGLNGKSFSQNLWQPFGYRGDDLTLDDEWFLETNMSSRLTESFMYGVSFMNTSSDYYTKLAGLYNFNSDTNLSGIFGAFDDGGKYYALGFSLGGLSLDFSRYQSQFDSTSYSLADYRFGLSSYGDTSINYNHSLLGGNLYLHASKGERSTVFNGNKLYDYYNANIGYNYFFDDISLDVTLGMENGLAYNNYRDIYRVDLSVSIPFGDNIQTNFSMSQNTNHKGNYRAAYTQNNIINHEGLTLDGELGMSADKIDQDYDAAIRSNYQNEALKAGLDLNINTNGGTGIYGSFESTQIINTHEVISTKETSKSYIVVRNRAEQDLEHGELYAVASIKTDGKSSVGSVLENSTEVMPTQSYHDYSVVIDTDASDFSNNMSSFFSASSRPGRVITVETDLYKVESYLSTFQDLEGKGIVDVKCVGEACLDIEQVVKGVYKFKIKSGLPYKLVSNEQRCFLPESRNDGQNLGNNFCMPEFEANAYGIEVAQFKDGENFYYIGSFSDEGIIEKYSQMLSDVDSQILFKKLGKVTHIFVQSDQILTADIFNIISQFKQYALIEAGTLPYAKSE